LYAFASASRTGALNQTSTLPMQAHQSLGDRKIKNSFYVHFGLRAKLQLSYFSYRCSKA
jgi:hypothetical protein